MLCVTLSRPEFDDPAFGAAWQRDAVAWGASAFLSWAWVGCLAGERFPDPVLAEVSEGGVSVGRALFNRQHGRLGVSYYLHESGFPALDAVFVEHNGVLAMPGREADVLRSILVALAGPASRVVLSGVTDGLLAAARDVGMTGPEQTRLAPFARLDAGAPFTQGLSRNTGAQLRRSDRSYTEAGPIAITRAATVEQAEDWLGRLVAWHEARWSARGVVSGFLSAPVQRFHRALILRGVPSGVVDLMRVKAGERVVGYLLNLRGGGRVSAYQSGFDYAGAAPHEKPGLTSHAAAAEKARLEGVVEYDFLAGDARYKRSLGNDVRALHWLGWQRGLSVPGVVATVRSALGR